MNVLGVLETCLYAGDLEAAEAFYSGPLGLEVIAREAGRHVFFRAGRGVLLVFDPKATAVKASLVNGAPIPLHGARGPGHVALAIREEDRAGWCEKLRAAGVAIESEVAWPEGGRSIYFRDPAGNSVELATPRLWGIEESLWKI
jgi:catechol 2,3-dioxygenase-like lactoylglutathione lyase family enzyme